jgi:hypothetical protein
VAFESVAGSFEVDDVGVVDDPVDHRGGDRQVAEYVVGCCEDFGQRN